MGNCCGSLIFKIQKMGFLTDKVNEAGVQILEWQSKMIGYKNEYEYLKERMKVQLYAMESNEEYSEEDINELKDLISKL